MYMFSFARVMGALCSAALVALALFPSDARGQTGGAVDLSRSFEIKPGLLNHTCMSMNAALFTPAFTCLSTASMQLQLQASSALSLLFFIVTCVHPIQSPRMYLSRHRVARSHALFDTFREVVFPQLDTCMLS